MSESYPTYDELRKNVKEMQKYIAGLQKQIKVGGMEDKEDKDDEHSAAFKIANDMMEKKEKEAMQEKDEMDKMKEAFKKAMDEPDPEKKKDMEKEAMSMMNEHEKKKEGMKDDMPGHKEDMKKMAAIENKIKQPIIEKILTANKLVNPTISKKLESELRTASLEQVEKKWAELEPFAAAIGTATGVNVDAPKTAGIPFAASTVLDGETPQLHIASSDDEFANLDTEKLLQERAGVY